LCNAAVLGKLFDRKIPLINAVSDIDERAHRAVYQRV